MIEKSLIKKMASYILRSRSKSFFDRSIMHPKREWLLGVTVGLVVAGLGIFWSVRTYSQFSHISIEGASTEEEDVIYRESLIETALADFAARKTAYSELKIQLLNKYQKDSVVVPELEAFISTSTNETSVITEDEIIEEPVSEVGEITFE